MKKTTIKTGLLIAAGLFTLCTNAQDKTTDRIKKLGHSLEFEKCATLEYEALLQKNNPNRPSKEKFESWIASKIEAQKKQRSAQNVSEVVTIPVVVHVIHNGDAVGVNENISEGQILSQITVLNQDFSREAGSHGFNDNPVGASMDIAFCMAQRDPYGLASNGIVRYSLGSEGPWDMDELELIKARTQWDPEKYLNLWVVNQIVVSGVAELAGYAQFPVDSGLDGLDEGTGTAAATDGVAIGYLYFGSQEIYAQGSYSETRNLGRTASHEVGHFFGLRHIWGDADNCTADDYCADTPIARSANTGCPQEGFDSCTARPGTDMFQNYMDYTDDACQNIFTANQKERMQAVVANSPRRLSLTTSNGCVPGQTFNNDGSLNIQSLNNNCSMEFSPAVILANPGNNAITSAEFTYAIDNDATVTYNWTGNLAHGEETIIILPEVAAASGNHTFTLSIVSVNGAEDEAPSNNTKIQNFNIVTRFNTTQIIVNVATDGNGNETVWLLQDSSGELIATNIDFDDPDNIVFYDDNTVYAQTVDVTTTGCYNFTIVDTGSNGLCCTNGDGYYNIKTTNGELIVSGGQFTDIETHTFSINAVLGTDKVSAIASTIKLYPNPSNNVINIAIPQVTTLPDAYTVYNNLGQMVSAGKIQGNNEEINISGYANGIYFIKLNGGSTTQTLQFIKY